MRGSLLVGSGREDTSFFQKIVDPTGAAGGNQTVNPTRTSTFDQVLPVLEIDLGVEYGLNLGKSRLFVRGGVLDQSYFDAGNAISNSGNFSLFGGKPSLGINY